MIRLDKINKSYQVGTGHLQVLRDVALHVEEGEFVSIMGSSGSGKSTLLNVLGILDDYDSGEYWLGDTLIRNLSQSKAAYYRSRHIGFVFQSFNLLPFKTAVENVALPLYYQKVGRRQRLKTAHQYLERVGLDKWAEHRPSEMSGGQKQRIAIARAILKDAPILVLDEATSSLDSRSEHLVQEALDRLMKGRTTLIIAHRLSTIAHVDRIVTLKSGRVDEIGSPAELAKTEGIYAQLLELQMGNTEKAKKALRAYEIVAK